MFAGFALILQLESYVYTLLGIKHNHCGGLPSPYLLLI